MTNQAPPEKTFRSYTSDQGKNYAKHRWNYSQDLYQSIIAHHTSTGGKLGTVLDAGCGPGTATFSLAQSFDNAIGLDPSDGMISTARSLLEAEQPKSNIKFEVSTVEDIDPSMIPDSSVDLITAATCAHVSPNVITDGHIAHIRSQKSKQQSCYCILPSPIFFVSLGTALHHMN